MTGESRPAGARFDGASTEAGARPLDVAVIGAGIAGLSAAWLLARRHRVTLYEAEERPGGHSHTVDVARPGRAAAGIGVDTGFIVYNEPAYPNLTALFEHLGVATRATEMSFAVSADGGALEYAGTSLRTLFAQPANLARPRFWSMLRDLLRFYREAPRRAAAVGAMPLGEFLDRDGYGQAFREDHLYPMAAAIWSAPAARVSGMATEAFVRFCENHHLLQLSDRPPWRTVVGGSRAYVDRMTAALQGRLRLGAGVTELRREAGGVALRIEGSADAARHEHVVIATHADQALRMLSDPSGDEQRLLGAFGYTRNHAVLHGDAALMPRRRRVWSSWNALIDRTRPAAAPCVSYWMNRLQAIDPQLPLFVTLNPPRPPRAECLIRSQTVEHPVFDAAALQAQRKLWSLQGRRRTWFCGAYFGAGFHEDGLQAGLAVAEALGGVRRPWRVADESGRIHLHPTFAAR